MYFSSININLYLWFKEDIYLHRESIIDFSVSIDGSVRHSFSASCTSEYEHMCMCCGILSAPVVICRVRHWAIDSRLILLLQLFLSMLYIYNWGSEAREGALQRLL